MIERSRESLIRIAALWGIDEKELVKLIRNGKGSKESFSEEKWIKYIRIIKRNARCPLCHEQLDGPYPGNVYICHTHRHRNIWSYVGVLLNAWGADKVLEHITRKCEHDLFKLECDTCMGELLKTHLNTAAPG